MPRSGEGTPAIGHDTRRSDAEMMRVLWLSLVAAIIGLFPFTVYATFLVPIADAARLDVATTGSLRGLGGVAALITGAALAPLFARWAPARVCACALTLLAAASLVATLGAAWSLVVFCLLVGLSTALLMPVLLTDASRRFTDQPSSSRAVTLVTSVQSLAAVAAGPVIGALALLAGWRGALWVTAALALIVAAGFLARGEFSAAASEELIRPGYRESFAALARRSDLLALIAIGALRTASFMGYLSFLAAFAHDRLGIGAVAFTLVWGLSGTSFFVGNFLTGRWASRAVLGRRPLGATLSGALLVVAAAVVAAMSTEHLAVVLASVVLLGLGHAVVAGLVSTRISQGAGTLTPMAFSLHAAGMSGAVFVGAAVGGLGLSLGGYRALGVSLAVFPLLALAAVPLAARCLARSGRC